MWEMSRVHSFLCCAALFATTQGQLLISTARTKLGGVFPGRNGQRLIELHNSHRSLSPSLSKYSTFLPAQNEISFKVDLLVLTAHCF